MNEGHPLDSTTLNLDSDRLPEFSSSVSVSQDAADETDRAGAIIEARDGDALALRVQAYPLEPTNTDSLIPIDYLCLGHPFQ